MAYAKISVPRFNGILQRPRLFKLLDEMSGTNGIWVSGPPGAGKTSLVGSYLEASGNSVLWYHLDRSDSDLSSFFAYFGEALMQTCKTGIDSLPKFTTEQTLDLPLFCSRYFRQVFECLPDTCAIVLDDYHQAASKTLDHFLKAAIMEAPADIRIFIISRTPPPSLLARERANRSLGIIDWDKLKFDAEEISGLCDAAGIQGNGDLVANLSQKTLGWAAGLILLLEKTRRGDPVNWTLSSGHSPEAIFNYFAEEIFELEDQRSQQTLLALAFLPQYTQHMVAEITGDPHAGEIVDDLSRKNFFTDKRSGTIETYQFHALFREFLARKVTATYSASDLRKLQKTSALLVEQNRDFDAAVDLYHELENFSEVERVILSQADGLWSRGHFETISRWIRQLPYEWVEARPMLLYWSAKAEFFTNPLRARQLMELAYPGFAATGQIPQQVMAASEILRCYFNERRNFQQIEPWIERLENLLREHGEKLSAPLQASAMCGLLFALLLRQPHRQLLGDCADRLSVLMHRELEANLKISMATCLLDYYTWRGQFPLCEEVLAHARPLLELPEAATLTRVLFGITKLHYFASRADYLAAKTEFEALIQLVLKDKQFVLRPMIYLHYVQACLSTGRVQEAGSLIAALDRIIDPRRSIDLMMLHLVRSWRSLLQGDAALATKEAGCMLSLYADSAASGTYAHGLMAFAMASAMAGEHGVVADTVGEARRLLRGMDSPFLEFHILLIEAYAQLRSGRREACRQSLAAALLLAKREGLLNTVQWVPDVIAPLCAEALEAGIEPEYVTRLIRARQLSPPAGCYMSHWPWPIEIRVLGSFEIRIAGEPLQFTHKAQKKPLEFLKLLIVQGGKNVNAEKTADTLWPDSDGDAAQNSFDSTLYRLRKLLRHDDIVTLSEGKLSLNPSLCWLDIWALDKLAEEIAASPSVDRSSHQAMQLLQIYRGPFLSADADFPGQSQVSANHRNKFERCLMDLCSIVQATEKTEQAIALLEQGMERDAEAKMLPMLLRDLRGQVL
jgi:LuxR family maltose regulon positive regulatory protein